MSVTRRRLPVDDCGDGARRNTDRRRSVRARLGRGALLVAAGTAALSLGGPFALRPFAAVAGAAGDVAVGIVLDFGGSGSDQVAGCVKTPPTANQYNTLATFAKQNHLPVPKYNSNGTLCSIGGTPATGCDQHVAGGFIYWAYFTSGGGGWTYANPAAIGQVTPGVVLGWRFQNPGAGNASDPPPRTAPDYDSLCPQPPPPPTTTTTAAAAPGAPGKSGSTATSPHRSRQRTTDQVFGTPASAGSLSSSASTSSTSSSTSTSTYPPDTPTSLPSVDIPADPEVGVVTHKKAKPSGTGPDPVIIVALIVAGLAIAGYSRWRRRPLEP